jgi:branched-subunit amino acid ABC-type transport system permease component
MEDLLEQVIYGLTLGSMYAMVAAGLALMFGVVRLINFAHGEFFMLGAYAFWFAYRVLGLPCPVAGLAAALAVGVFGIAYQQTVIRAVLDRSWHVQLIATLATSIVLTNLDHRVRYPGQGGPHPARRARPRAGRGAHRVATRPGAGSDARDLRGPALVRPPGQGGQGHAHDVPEPQGLRRGRCGRGARGALDVRARRRPRRRRRRTRDAATTTSSPTWERF